MNGDYNHVWRHRKNPWSGISRILIFGNDCLSIANYYGTPVLSSGSPQGHAEWCNPYFDDCTSISNIGRKMPEYLVFKLGMVASGICIIRFWQLSQEWLSLFSLGQPMLDRKLAVIGLIAGCSLILYTLGLGHESHIAYLARRTGVVVYFGLSYIAQCLIVLKLSQLILQSNSRQPWTLKAMIILCLILLIFGISIVLLDIFTSLKDRLERPLEWITALMLSLNYGLLWCTSITEHADSSWPRAMPPYQLIVPCLTCR